MPGLCVFEILGREERKREREEEMSRRAKKEGRRQRDKRKG